MRDAIELQRGGGFLPVDSPVWVVGSIYTEPSVSFGKVGVGGGGRETHNVRAGSGIVAEDGRLLWLCGESDGGGSGGGEPCAPESARAGGGVWPRRRLRTEESGCECHGIGGGEERDMPEIRSLSLCERGNATAGLWGAGVRRCGGEVTGFVGGGRSR